MISDFINNYLYKLLFIPHVGSNEVMSLQIIPVNDALWFPEMKPVTGVLYLTFNANGSFC